MRLYNYRLFTEKMGISLEIEEQVNSYMQEIKNNSDKSMFRFVYSNNLGTFNFTLKINQALKNSGNVQIVSRTNFTYIITLKDRNDISTLLHEVKHMDYSIRNKDGKLNNPYNLSRASLNAHPNQTDNIKILLWIFYIYNDDEFQSQFQSLYKSFEIRFVEKIKDMKKEDITYNLIHTELEDFINNGEYKFVTMFYFMKAKFKFDIFCPEKILNKVFLYLISSKEIDVLFTEKNPYKGLYKSIKYSLERLIRSVFNTYSTEQKKEIEKVKSFFEKDINRKNKVYSRKVLRIVTLIYDKYHG